MRQKLWKICTSLKLAIVLMSVIACLCTIATLLPQGREAAFYTQTYGNVFGTVIVALAFHRVFASGLFYLLGAIFAVNLCCCTVRRFQWARIKSRTQITAWGSPILHVGLIVVMVGVGISLLLAREAFYQLMIGESVEIYEASMPYTLTVQDVSVEYYPDSNVPYQYTSTLSLTQDDGTSETMQVSVNDRGRFLGSGILQSDYGWAVQMEVDDNGVKQQIALKNQDWLDLTRAQQGAWKIGASFFPDYAEDAQNGPYTKSDHPRNPKLIAMLAKDNEPVSLTVLAQGETQPLTDDIDVTFHDYNYYTGLHIKYDPGVPWIFVGFVIVCIGLIIRFWPNQSPRKGEKTTR